MVSQEIVFKDRAIGKKKSPGPLYGIKGDQWAALAVALCLGDRIQAKEKMGSNEP
jgi:hypothetical protein